MILDPLPSPKQTPEQCLPKGWIFKDIFHGVNIFFPFCPPVRFAPGDTASIDKAMAAPEDYTDNCIRTKGPRYWVSWLPDKYVPRWPGSFC